MKKLLSLLLAVLPSAAPAAELTARGWIIATKQQPAHWQQFDTLQLPSGSIFIGDPSWGDDYHLRGAAPVPAPALNVWLLISNDNRQVHAVWLEAGGGVPKSIAHSLDFGVDSAYLALGDLTTGQQLANIGDLGLPGFPDSYEFMLPHVDDETYFGKWIPVPPHNHPVFAVETGRDGGLRAVWLNDATGAFSGILIDISGRASDGHYIDQLVGQ